MSKRGDTIVHKSPEVGQEVSCVICGLEKKILLDNKKLKQIFTDSLSKNKFTLLEISEHNFSPQGYTATFTLAESHLAVHTYPEYNSIYLGMYSCRGPEDAKPVIDYIIRILNPQKIKKITNRKVPIRNTF